jgi:tetratricopeptide (TPR) repeat protein
MTSPILRVMRIAFFVLIASLCKPIEAQDSLSAEQWQEDLRFLQHYVHQNHPFLFKKINADTFDAQVEILDQKIPELEPHEVVVGLARIVSSFEYGHTQIPFSTVAKGGVLPVNLYYFNDGIYIEGVMRPHESVLGAKVMKVAGIPVEEALSAIKPVVPVENDQYFKAYGLRFLTVPDVLHAQGVLAERSDAVTLTLEKEGQTFDYELPKVKLEVLSRGYTLTIPNDRWLSARHQEETPLYLKHLNEKFYYFEYLPDTRTVYVRQSSVFDDETEPLADFYERLFAFTDSTEVNRLIYDVRLNGGGNNYNNLNLIKGLMARPEINIQGKLFFIIGRNTFSACQNLVNDIGTFTEAIFVGEPTAENVNFYGDNRPVTLPNSGIKAYLSYAWWQDKPQWENRDATVPHLAVDMSFEEYRSNQDPVLDAALNYRDDGFILDPMQHLTALFMQGDMERLKADAIEIARDPKYRYYDFEEEVSKAGGRLLQGGNTEGALLVFQLIVDAYPDKPGPLYNLASTLEQAQRKEEAIRSYQLLLQKFPESQLATAAENRLMALRKD